MEKREIKKPFARATLESLSWSKGEPSWMTEVRLAAWKRFEDLGAPHSLADAALNRIEAFQEPPRTAAPAHEWPSDLQHALDERGDEEGLIIQRDATVLSRAITKEAAKRGVIFTDLDTAVKAVPELVRTYFSRRLPQDKPWIALNTAFWSGGTFLYVPAHVKIQLPFHTCYWLSSPHAAIFPLTVLVAEGGSVVSFVDEFLSITRSEPDLSVSVAELIVRERARVSYTLRPNWGGHVVHERWQESQVEGSGKLNCFEERGPREKMTLERVAELYPEVRV